MVSKKKTLKACIGNFRYAFKGVRTLFREEYNMRIHTLAACLTVLAGWFFEVSRLEWVTLFFAIGFVFAAEAFNSAVERLGDRITYEVDPLIGDAKDLGAAAVLFAAIVSVIIGLIIFVPKIAEWFAVNL